MQRKFPPPGIFFYFNVDLPLSLTGLRTSGPTKQPSQNEESLLAGTQPPSPISYDLTIPCPGQGLGGTWEVCAWGNVCSVCTLCKVCGHCQPTCPEYIDLTASSSPPPPQVSDAQKQTSGMSENLASSQTGGTTSLPVVSY